MGVGLQNAVIGASTALNSFNASQEHAQDRAYQTKVRDMDMQVKQAGLNDANQRRAWQSRYESALRDAPEGQDVSQTIMDTARSLGDVNTYNSAQQAYVANRAAALKQSAQGAIMAAQAGDLQPTVDLYNKAFPNIGYKASLQAAPDGSKSIVFSDPSGKIVSRKDNITPQDATTIAAGLSDPATMGKLIVANVEHGYKAQEGAADRASKEKIAAGNNAATLGAANTSASARRYAADQGLAGAQYRADHPAAGATKDNTDAQVKNANSVIRFSLTGSNTMASLDSNTQKIYDAASARAGELVRQGVPFEQAATQALTEARKGVAVDNLPGMKSGGAGLSTGSQSVLDAVLNGTAK